jgi:glutamate synthase domain-containing protein 3
MGVSAVAGAVVGGLMQGRAQSRAARANRRQQEAALAFQEKQIQRGEKIAKGAFKFGRQAALAQAEKASREAEAAIASRAYDPAGTIGLGMKRALATGASQEISRLYENIAQMRMANLQGQSFPMVTQAGPQGNWAADAARLAMQLGSSGPSAGQLTAGGMGMQQAGQALSGAGLGMFGAATQMAGQAMTEAGMSE